MTALIVSVVIIAVIALLLLMWGGIILKYDGELTITVTVLFFKFRLFPKKQKKINLRKFSYENYKKRLEKERKKQEKKAAKKAAKDQKKSVAANESPKKKTASETIEDIKDYVALALDTVKCFLSHLRIDVFRALVTVGGKDAASTALTYGIVSQSVAYLAETLSNVTHFRRRYNTKIEVVPDFLSDRISAEIEIRFRVRLIHLIHVALRGGLGYLKIVAKK